MKHQALYNCYGHRCVTDSVTETLSLNGAGVTKDIVANYAGGATFSSIPITSPISGKPSLYVLDKLVWTLAFTGAYAPGNFGTGAALANGVSIVYVSTVQWTGGIAGSLMGGNTSIMSHDGFSAFGRNYEHVLDAGAGANENLMTVTIVPEAPIYLCSGGTDQINVNIDDDFSARGLTKNRFVAFYSAAFDLTA